MAVCLLIAPSTASAQISGRIACPTSLSTSSVTVTTTAGDAHVFTAEIADTPDTRACGLMFRQSLAQDAAMLFVYPAPGNLAFWMENTLIPLDIIFVDEDGRVVNVAAEAKPLDRTSLPAAGPSQFVLEIQGGLAAKLGIGPGATLRSLAMLDAALPAR